MVAKIKNKRSKRTTTAQRAKAEKKLREHNRKLRKEKKKNPQKFRKSKKDPGVPNMCPFKEDVLKEADNIRRTKQAEKEKRREEAKQRRKEEKEKLLEKKRAQGLEGLVAEAQVKENAFEIGKSFEDEVRQHGVTDRSAKAYYKEFTKVVEAADVVLQVLDARDPEGTRCNEVEQAVLNAGKRVVLVINKADLVPKDILEKWIKHLRQQLPCIAFKASTQTQGNRLGQAKVSIAKSNESQLQTSKCVGADTLMTLLGNYCRNKDVKTSIRVGVVGLPNVGKSSLINSMKRSRACTVGSTPGVTKSMQEVQLDKKVKLIDSPGMVLASGNMSDASVALRNAMKVENLSDPITPVDAILQRCNKQQMMLQYKITEYEDVSEFLSLIARGMGKLKKGGIPDREMAARVVLTDWNTGKIKYYTHPPEATNAQVEATIVSEFSKEFSLEALDAMETEDMDRLPVVLPSETMLVSSSGMVMETQKQDEEMEDEEEEEEEEMEDGPLPKAMQVQMPKRKKQDSMEKADLPKFKSEGLDKLKKASKVREKKERKERRRRDKVSQDLSHSLEAAFEGMGKKEDEDLEL